MGFKSLRCHLPLSKLTKIVVITPDGNSTARRAELTSLSRRPTHLGSNLSVNADSHIRTTGHRSCYLGIGDKNYVLKL